MTGAAWRYVYTSVRGTGHIGSDLPCQDASRVLLAINSQDEPLLLLVASDGAGSAARSEEGSRMVCEEVVKFLALRFNAAEYRPAGDLGVEIAHTLRGQLVTLAEDLGCSLRDLACTLSVAVLLSDWAWFMQIGDGAIVVQRSVADPFEVVFWPDNGEYANQTYFLTDVPDAHVHTRLDERPLDRVSVITDGLQTLALVLAEQRAHPPFYLPMFGTLEAAPGGGEQAHRVLVPALSGFLDSSGINARTNDDKTLILASRVPTAVPEKPSGLLGDSELAVTGDVPERQAPTPAEDAPSPAAPEALPEHA